MIDDSTHPPSKRAIVSAALRLFVRDGYKETTIRAIADEAGYTNPALFKFFATKDDLGAHIFVRCHRAFVARIEQHLVDDGPLDDVIPRWVGAFLDLLAEDRDVVLFVHEHASTFAPMPSVAEQIDGDPFARLHAWLRRARTAGRVSTVTPLRLQAVMLVGTLHQLARVIDVPTAGAERRKLERDTAHLLVAALRA